METHTHSDTSHPNQAASQRHSPRTPYTALIHIHMTRHRDTQASAHILTYIPKDTQAPDTTIGTNIQTPQTHDTLTHSSRYSTEHARNWPMPQHITASQWFVCAERRHSSRDNIQKRLLRYQWIKTCPHANISTSNTARLMDSHAPDASLHGFR